MKAILSIFCHIAVSFGPYTRDLKYDFLLANEIFPKAKLEDKK